MNWKIILAAGAILFSGALYAQPITVPDDYSTIQLAINAAVPGDTVHVRAGTYFEHVTISKSLTLQGEDRETTIIDGSGTGKVVTVTSSHVTVSGFTIRNSGNSYANFWDQDAGIALRYGSHNLISDCIITANGLSGLYSYRSSYNTIRNCDFSGNGFVSGAGFIGVIHLRYSPYNTIADNNIYSNHYSGITIRSWSSSTAITGNHVFSNQGHGIHVGWSSSCNITNNNVHDNSTGVDFDAANSNTVRDNILSSNGSGIRTVYYSYSDKFIGNVIRENGTGIIIGGYELGSSGHVFHHNDVINNDTQVLIKVGGSNTWDNGYPDGGNFWTDYTGEDLDNDGLGDTPYVINASNQDNYPLMKSVHSIPVLIDIKPGGDPNGINLRSKGKIPVAILATDNFDPWEVDSSALAFGPDGAGIAPSMDHAEDVDGDGDIDMVVHFNTQETGIACGDTEAALNGETFNGTRIEGADLVKTTGCK